MKQKILSSLLRHSATVLRMLVKLYLKEEEQIYAETNINFPINLSFSWQWIQVTKGFLSLMPSLSQGF